MQYYTKHTLLWASSENNDNDMTPFPHHNHHTVKMLFRYHPSLDMMSAQPTDKMPKHGPLIDVVETIKITMPEPDESVGEADAMDPLSVYITIMAPVYGDIVVSTVEEDGSKTPYELEQQPSPRIVASWGQRTELSLQTEVPRNTRVFRKFELKYVNMLWL